MVQWSNKFFKCCTLVSFLEIYEAHLHIKALRSPAVKKNKNSVFLNFIYLITGSFLKDSWKFLMEIGLYFGRW